MKWKNIASDTQQIVYQKLLHTSSTPHTKHTPVALTRFTPCIPLHPHTHPHTHTPYILTIYSVHIQHPLQFTPSPSHTLHHYLFTLQFIYIWLAGSPYCTKMFCLKYKMLCVKMLKSVIQQVCKLGNWTLSEPFSPTSRREMEFELRNSLPCIDCLTFVNCGHLKIFYCSLT